MITMKLTAELNGQDHELRLESGSSHVTASVDGRDYDLDVRTLGGGAFLLNLHGKVFECRVERSGAAHDRLSVLVGTRTYSLSLHDPKRLRGSHSRDTHAGGSAEVVAAMPGKVVRVLVQAGVDVEAGDGVVVVEAMKMQNELKAPRAGKVIEIHAEIGATVNAGDVLAVIE